jgi:hypothetical protein
LPSCISLTCSFALRVFLAWIFAISFLGLPILDSLYGFALVCNSFGYFR